MDNAKDLIQIPKGKEVTIQNEDDAFLETTKTGDYLPRLQLLTSQSDVVKEGKFPINHFAIVRDKNNQDLGESVDILVIAWRPRALEIGEEIINSYVTKSDLFKSIAEKSNEFDSGCLFGPEFLVWVPEAETFATFFMSSKTMRREAANVRKFLKKAGTLKPQKVSNKKYSWYSPFINPCTSVFELPTKEAILKEYEKFMNPPEQTVEKAPEEEKRAR